MKSLRKLFTLALALLLILECFAGPALATTTDAIEEPLVVVDEAMATLESSEPESSEPESSETESSVPESSIPESSVPENTVPQTSETESSVPESSETESSVPGSSDPEPSVPESSVPDVTVPEISEPEPSEPTIVDSGKCGTNLTWTLDSDNVLTISGTGAMTNYTKSDKPAPWIEHNVKKLVVKSGVTSIGNYAFFDLPLLSMELPHTLKTIGTYSFADTKLETVIIPEGVTSIGASAFIGSNVREVGLPDTLKTIGKYAFCDTPLVEIYIPDSVTSLGFGVFDSCSRMTAAYISSGLSTIAEQAFVHCEKLEYIILPASIKTIQSAAFENCGSLTAIYYLGTEKQMDAIEIDDYNAVLFEADWYLTTIITKDPEDVFISDGGTASFSAATNRSGCKYQWYYLEPGSVDWKACSGTSATKATYSFTAKESMDGYQYYCKITGDFDGYLETTIATLTIIPAPKITKQPTNAKAKNGQPVSVSIEATGEELTYQWYFAKKGSSTFSKSSVTSSTYTTTMTTSVDGRKVYCVITDKGGQTVKSNTVTLSWETTPLVITKQPASVSVKDGKKATVTVEAEGDGLTYQWYFAPKGSTKFSKASITTATYSVVMNSSRDGRRIYCVITDAYGKTVKTNTVTLSLETTPLVITKQPESVTVNYGKNAKVTVEAEGDGLKYQWYFAPKGSTKFSKASITKATYSAVMNSSRNGRRLYCVITDKYGKTVKTDVVTINLKKIPLEITTQPAGTTVGYGKTATVSVTAQGDGLKYQWYFAKKGSTKFSKASITQATYTAQMNTSRNGRQLYCIITDAYGKTVKTDVVSINLQKAPLAITQQPESVTVKYGERAKATVKAQGDGLKYQWYYANKGSSKFSKASITKATYSAEMNASRDGRRIYCVITDAYGKTVKTETVTLSMDSVPFKITKQPESVSAKYNKTASVTVEAEGDGLSYQWYFAKKGSSKFSKASVKTPTYSVKMDPSRDGRKVYCVITDAYGKTKKTNTVTLTLEKTPLKIVKQTREAALAPGESRDLVIEAQGDGLKYQWYLTKNAENYTKFYKSSVTSNVYPVTMTADKHRRRFYCVVTDAYGNSVKSDIIWIYID